MMNRIVGIRTEKKFNSVPARYMTPTVQTTLRLMATNGSRMQR